MTPSNKTAVLGVVGASARAAVLSLARAGIAAWAVDLFGDRDLTRMAECAVCPFESYPDAIPALASRFPPGPVLYTGGLENHPRVIAELAASREVWGNSPEVIERVRDPQALSAVLAGNGFAHPRVLPTDVPCPSSGRWLMKPRRSSGGAGVREALAGEVPSTREYLQEFVPGPSMSAVFSGDGTRVELVGVTEQLVGTTWLHAGGYKYAGNVGPTAVSPDVVCMLHLLGSRLMTRFRLSGVFGVDFILHDSSPCVVEVNPRYPASVEVLEHATGKPVFGSATDAAGSLGAVGKAIYYAPQHLTFPASGPWDDDLAGEFDPWRVPAFADIPRPGAAIEKGWPVLTILACSSSPEEVRERLQSRAAELDQLLADASP